jgi:hypothetical protein
MDVPELLQGACMRSEAVLKRFTNENRPVCARTAGCMP